VRIRKVLIIAHLFQMQIVHRVALCALPAQNAVLYLVRLRIFVIALVSTGHGMIIFKRAWRKKANC
jgi:hypothetical protein